MCLSKLSQLIYGIIVVCAIAFTLGSMFTPGWRVIHAELKNQTDPTKIANETITKGIFPFACAFDDHGSLTNKTAAFDACEKWWNDQPTYEKIVVALMLLTLAVSILAFIWNALTFFCCIGQGGIFRPLPSLAATATICLLVAIIVFYANKSKDIEIIKSWKEVDVVEDMSNVSYSFYLAIVAMVLSFVNVIVGSCIVQAADKCL